MKRRSDWLYYVAIAGLAALPVALVALALAAYDWDWRCMLVECRVCK